MKKIVSITISLLLSQVFYLNVFGQTNDELDVNHIYTKDITVYRVASEWSGGSLSELMGGLRSQNSNLELYRNSASSSIIFTFNGFNGLEMKRGANGDFTMYFPNTDNSNSKWNRFEIVIRFENIVRP